MMESSQRTSRLILVLVMLVFVGLSEATESGESAQGARPGRDATTVAGSGSGGGAIMTVPTGSMSIPSYVVHGLAVIGGVVVAILGAAAISALLLPLFGIRPCYLIGTCADPYNFAHGPTAYEMPYHAYGQVPYPSPNFAKSGDGIGNELPQYDAYSQVSYPTSYQKRSLEYVGPILKALGSAYGKYGQQIPGNGTPRKAVDAPPSSILETSRQTIGDDNDK